MIKLFFLTGMLFCIPMIESAIGSETSDQCFSAMKALPGKTKEAELKQACIDAQVLDSCQSELGVKIFHIDRKSNPTTKDPKRILVFALIHGDELPSGSVSRSWIERLATIQPRNTWRVVPILNPDGVKKKTRFNANGVDINRNFPTNNWDKEAKAYWEKNTKKDIRRFPGKAPGTEKETKCAMAHIEDFKPNLILSLHIPYGVLDFDGPKIHPPNFPHIPWKSLGNYPGSLGRYMWVDRSKPTLTVELQSSGVVEKLEKFDKLQDISGDIVLETEKILKEKSKSAGKHK